MSTIERPVDRLERIGDRANPILVKETRQSLKSRQFVVTFMLLLAASWFLFTLGLALGGDAIEYGAVGNSFFQLFYWILAIAVMVIVPFGAYRSLLAEKDQETYDLLNITTLSPGQIVWGKLLSASVQVLIFYSAIAPFIAFTSLLQGFDFVAVTFKLGLTFLLSMLVAMAAIASSAMTKQRQWQGLTSIVMLFMLFVGMFLLLSPIDGFLFLYSVQDAEAWWALGIVVAAAGSYFLLFHQVAVAQLTFESDNRATGIRLVAAGQFLLLWGALVALDRVGPAGFSLDDQVLTAALILSVVHLGVIGLFAVTESPYLSRRIRRNLPRSSFRRLLFVPLLQGGHRGYLYVLLHVAALITLITGLTLTTAGTNSTWEVAMASIGYVVIYLGIGCIMGRWCAGLSADIRPGHVRVLTLVLASLLAVIPMGIQVFFRWGSFNSMRYSLLQLPNPFWTVMHISENGYYSDMALPLVGLVAILAVLANLAAIKRGMAEVVFADVK